MEDREQQVNTNTSNNIAGAPQFYDWVMEERVTEHRKNGLWCDFGSKFAGVQLRLRTAQSGAVLVKKESATEEARLRLGLSDKDDLPIEESLKVSKAMAVMAVTGARGSFSASPEMLAIARRNGWAITSSGSFEVITFNGTEDPEAVRNCLSVMINRSDRWSLKIFRAINAMDDVEDAKIDAVGESFVFGQHESQDWAD